MKRSTDRILTTHTGSLARPTDLLDLMKVKESREPYDHEVYATRVRSAVAEVVRKQAESGVDVVNDGEQSKTGFANYIRERLTGFEPLKADVVAFHNHEVRTSVEHNHLAISDTDPSPNPRPEVGIDALNQSALKPQGMV